MNIRLLYPDGTVQAAAVGDTLTDISLTTATDADVSFLTLTPLRDGLKLLALECDIPLPEAITAHPADVLVYDNAAYTNDVTQVIPYKADAPMYTNELFVLKNVVEGTVFLCGYVTAKRFFATIYIHDGVVTFRFELEERLLNKNEAYLLEGFMTAEGNNDENALLEAYADRVAHLMNAIPTGSLPTGWCSWSCYYSDVNEENIRRAADKQVTYTKPGQANVVQIDDGWQYCNSFPGEWYTDETKFPEGMTATAKYVTDRDMTFGLWLAPLLVNDQSKYWNNVKHLAMPDVTLDAYNHPFDLGNPAYHELLRETFRRMTDEYGARYFKIDFIAAAFRFFNGNGYFVHFKDGFCIEVLRSALQVIRDTVGPDVFLLSCGAPLLASVGIFNGARMSCDIIWGKNPAFPTYLQIMQNCMHTVSWRYFYHRKIFVNDPDGLVLRDFDRGDGYNSTWAEAEFWSIAIAMSGGSVLSNDELENLSPARRKLYTRLLPPLDVAGHPVNYFESPAPTATVIDYSDTVKFVSLFNPDDKMKDLSFDLSAVGMDNALVVDCMTDKVIGITNTVKVANVNPHGGAMFLIRKPSGKTEFAFSDSDIWCGVHRFSVDTDGDAPIVTRPADAEDAAVYLLSPADTAPVGKTVWTGNGYTVTQI